MSAAPPGRSGPAAGTERAQPALSVLADLDLSVDGRSARLEGDGRHLVLTSEDPVHLWSTLGHASLPAEVGAVNGPRAVGRVATLLSDHGVTIDIVGPRGLLVQLGREARSGGPAGSLMSLTGRLMTGSDAVAPQSVRAVLPFGVRAGGLLGARAMGRLRSTDSTPGGVAGQPAGQAPEPAGGPVRDRNRGVALRSAAAVTGVAALAGALLSVLWRRRTRESG